MTGRVVETKQPRRRVGCGCEGFEARSVDLKMIRPAVLARMKQRNNLSGFGINRGEIASFAAIAERAGERKVFRSRPPAVLFRDDVVDLVESKGHRFIQTAVFAASTGPRADESPELDRNMGQAHWTVLPGLKSGPGPCLRHAHEMFDGLVTLPFRFLDRIEAHVAILREQFADAGLEFVRWPECEHFLRRGQFGQLVQDLSEPVKLAADGDIHLAQASRDDTGRLVREVAQIGREFLGQVQSYFHPGDLHAATLVRNR